MKSIQEFINSLEPNSIPLLVMKKEKKGYTNKRIVEDFNAMMFNIRIQYNYYPLFIVAYCTLALRIGLAHGLVPLQILYPKEGYFSNPDNTLDEAYNKYLQNIGDNHGLEKYFSDSIRRNVRY